MLVPPLRASHRRLSFAALFFVATSSLFGCSGDDFGPPVIEGAGSDAETGGPCEIGDERTCHVTLKQEAGIITCFDGHRECTDGTWSECLDGEVTDRVDPTSSRFGDSQTAALLPPNSTPEKCLANPCDPNCYFYDEDPEDITSTSTGLPSFPGTPAIVACDHDVCTAGAKLTAGCHECVDQVCAIQPSCCSTTWSSACADLAYETCAARPAPTTLCDFALFAENSVGFAGGYVKGGALGAANANGATGNVLTVASSNPIAAIFADGNASLTNTTVTNRVTLGGATLTQTGSTVGSSRLSQELSFAPLPTKTLSCLSVSGSLDVTTGTTTLSPGDARRINVNGAAARVVLSAPGKYGAVHLNSAGTLVFASPGTYVLDQLVIGATNSTLLYPPSGRVEVDTCSELDFPARTVSKRFTANDPCVGVLPYPRPSYSTGMTVQHNGQRYTCTVPGWCALGGAYEPGVGWASANAWTAGGSCALTYTNSGVNPAAYDTVFYTHDPALTLGAGALQGGVLIAPTSTVGFHGAGGNDLNGLVWARSVASTNTDVRIDATGLTGAACEAAALYVEPTYSCPIRNLIPAVPPALVDPCGSGQDCQINHRCVEPTTDDACQHSKCIRGVALDASCRNADFCVDRICDVDPTCCSGAWSQACADKVATVCDATCGIGECARDICSAGPAQDPTCDDCIEDVCAHMPSCCTTAWTQACVELVYDICGDGPPPSTPIGSSICDYAAYGGAEVIAQGENSSNRAFLYGGWVGSPNNNSMNVQFTYIDGNVTGSGSLNADFSTVTGNIVNGSGSYTGSGSSVGGTTDALPPAPALPVRTFTCTGMATPTGGSIAPGNYGNVVVPDGGTLTLSPGTYNFRSLRLGNGAAGATLALPSNGRVSVNVCGRVDFRENSSMSGLTKSTAMNVDIYANDAITAWGRNQLYGFLHAAGTASGPTPPNGPNETYRGGIWIGPSSTVYGLLIGEKRTDVRSATVDARDLSEACRSSGLDPSLVGTTSLPGRLCAYAGYSRTDAQLGSSSTVAAGHLGTGSVLVAGGGNKVFGNVYAHGNVTFTGNSAYYADVQSTGSITGTSSVNGKRQQNVPQVPSPTWPALPPADCAGGKPSGHSGDRAVTSGTTPLTPGKYGDVTLANNTALQLSAGVYFFGQLDFQATSRLLLPTTGDVTIHACGRVVFGNGFTQTGIAPGSDALRLRVYSFSSANADAAPAIAVHTGAAGLVAGVLIAPNGKIALSSSSRLRGLAWGNQLAFTGTGATIDATGLTGSTCEDADLDSLPVCPITVIPREPPESGECLPNHIGYEDPTCATYDLAADIPCGNVVPVCNHGRSDFNGNVTIAHWPASDRQMSLEMPTVSPAGTCNGSSLSIAAGNCVNVNCTIPSGTHTVLVDPTNTLSECGSGSFNRRLDNWTVADGRRCSGARSIEYEYRGICPADTSPRWGYLTWNTAAPGASRVVFSAKTAASSAELTSAMYAPLAVAASSPVDTTQCTVAGPTPTCPVPVSNVLSLGKNQDEYLALRIELEASGTDHPTLRDWILTYTCVFDQ